MTRRELFIEAVVRACRRQGYEPHYEELGKRWLFEGENLADGPVELIDIKECLACANAPWGSLVEYRDPQEVVCPDPEENDELDGMTIIPRVRYIGRGRTNGARVYVKITDVVAVYGASEGGCDVEIQPDGAEESFKLSDDAQTVARRIGVPFDEAENKETEDVESET